MKLPACCTDDMHKQMDGGVPAGKAMLSAMKNHEGGKHQEDEDGGDDGDEYEP